jgi:LPXTG-motif cell wall-anchored protein
VRQLAPLAVVYLLVAALVLPASPLAADDPPPPGQGQTQTSTAPEPASEPAQQQTGPAPPPQPEPAAGQPAAAPPQPAPAAPQPAPAAQAATPAKPKARAATPGSVTIKDFAFGPGSITVNVGESVTWNNNGPSGHSATARDGSFDTGILAKGKSASHTFTKAGSFSYICRPHPFMHGTVRVAAASAGGGSDDSGSANGSAAAPGSSGSSSGSSSSGSSAGSNGSGSALPKTGGDVAALALLGVLMLGLGVAVRRRSPAA